MDVGGIVLGPDQPIVGWRYWQMSRTGRLRSVTQKWIEWQPSHPLRAVCLEIHHPAPAAGCNCGVYATRDFATLRDHGLCLVPGVPIVVGQVALWGEVVTDDASWRAAFGRPQSLSLVEATVGEEKLDQALADLERYGVAVNLVSMDEAIGGASATMLTFQAMSLKTSRLAPPVGRPVDRPGGMPTPA